MNKELALTETQTRLKVVESNLKNAITEHANYKDKLGNVSKGPAGLALQVNIRIKKSFASNRDELNDRQLLLLIVLQQQIIDALQKGEKDKLLRADIKKIVYQLIENYAAVVKVAK